LPSSSTDESFVIRLDELLQIKRRAGRAKDLAGIPYIEATLAELSRKT
jgi:hypothetical protein